MSKISRRHAVTAASAVIARDFLENNADLEKNVQTALRKDQLVKKKKLDDHIRWYIKSYRHDPTKGQALTVQRFVDDCFDAIQGSVHLATISINALIEVYIKNWLLNFALAKIEKSENLDTNLTNIPDQLNPALPSKYATLSSLLNFPVIRGCIENIPPYLNDPKTRKPASVVSNGLTARRMLNFFQEYRNTIVHNNFFTTTDFFEKHGAFYNEKIRSIYGHLPEMKIGDPLPFHDDIFGVQAACFYRIAKELNEILILESSGRRGTLEEVDGKFDFSQDKRMLVQGDHEGSLQWVNDADYRGQIAVERGWALYLRKFPTA